MELSTRTEGGVTVVSVAVSRIDAASAIRFKDLVRVDTKDASDRVILNLDQVEFIDSSGLGAIVSVMKMLAPDRRLELSGLCPTVEKVFSLTRMDQVFVIHKGLANALSSDERQTHQGVH